MARKSNSTPIILIIILLVVALIAYAIYNFYSKPKFSWSEKYRYNKSQPYDGQVLYNLMNEVNGGGRLELWSDTNYVDTPEDEIPLNSNYIFVGQQHFLDSTENSFLLDFVRRGNNAFILCSFPSRMMLDSLIAWRTEYAYYEDDYDEGYGSQFKPMGTNPDSMAVMKFTRNEMVQDSTPELKFFSYYLPQSYRWRFFKDSLYSREGVFLEKLGTITTQHGTAINYVRISHGSGNFFLCSTPLVFSNYHLLKKQNMEYARQALAFLGTGKIYWDEYNRSPDVQDYMDNQNDPVPDDDTPQKGPLSFILSEPGLKYAWFLLLIAAALYLFFGGRRKQRSIPVNENRDNTSIEYAEVISQLFMKESDHKKLVLLKMDLFRAFLRERYALRLPLQMDLENDAFYKNVSEKSSVQFKLVRNIFEQYKYLSSITLVTTDVMLEFHNKLEEFYRTCK